MNEKYLPLTELQNSNWQWKLAFYVDLTKHTNKLKLKLLENKQLLLNLYINIKSFRQKIILFQSQLLKHLFTHFKTREIFSLTTETKIPVDFAVEV